MSKVVLLDSGPLGMYGNPKANPKTNPGNAECRRRVNELLVAGIEVRAPRIAVYEVRRELVCLQLRTPAAGRMERFDAAVAALGLIPITDEVLDRAAVLWGEARRNGVVTAHQEALDGDVILATQAVMEEEKGHEVEIATTNTSDLLRLFFHILNWDDLKK